MPERPNIVAGLFIFSDRFNTRDVRTMDFALTLLVVAVAWHMLRMRYQRARISLLGRHLANMKLERHMETLTQGYTRAIHEDSESRQLQVLDTFTQTENVVAANVQTLADAMQKESPRDTAMGPFAFCVPYVERVAPEAALRDFRALLHIHATGLRAVIANDAGLDPKTRAFHIAAELYLLQHSCHWFCKSRAVADARLLMRHKVDHKKVIESVSSATRAAYTQWVENTVAR